MKKFITTVAVATMCVLSSGSLIAQEAPPRDQQGIGERIGETVDRGLNRLGSELRRGWAEIRGSVDRLTVQGRVYSRLRWDKQTADVSFDIQVQDESTVTLIGNVPSEDIREKAITLAGDTVGVEKVIDRLQVVSPRPR